MSADPRIGCAYAKGMPKRWAPWRGIWPKPPACSLSGRRIEIQQQD